MIGIKVEDPKEFGTNFNPMQVNPERYNEENGLLVAFGSYIMIVQCPDTYVRHSQGTVVECTLPKGKVLAQQYTHVYMCDYLLNLSINILLLDVVACMIIRESNNSF